MNNLQVIRSVPPIRPISSLRQDQDAILDTMDKEPVILSQRGRERAVLVSVEQWNHMVALLEMYRGIWRAESNRVQAENQYVHADTLKEALATPKRSKRNALAPNIVCRQFARVSKSLIFLARLPAVSLAMRSAHSRANPEARVSLHGPEVSRELRRYWMI